MNRKDLPEANATCEICGGKYRICKKCSNLKARGIEAWRQHCDSYECAMYYYLLIDDIDNITQEVFDNVMKVELPEGRQLTKENQIKMDGIEHYLSEKNKQIEKEKAEAEVKKDIKNKEDAKVKEKTDDNK